MKMSESSQTGRKHCGKNENLLVTRNFSFSQSIFKRFGLHICINKGLFEKKVNPLPDDKF